MRLLFRGNSQRFSIWAAIALGLTIRLPALGQTTKLVQPSAQVWTAFYEQARLSNRWGASFDVQARRTDFLNRWATLIFRPGVVYYLSDNAQLSAGYAYARFYPAEGVGDVQPEHRPWQQIAWRSRFGRLETNYWIRTEERFRGNLTAGRRTDGYTFNWRFRLMTSAQLPLWGETTKPGVPALLLQNELWINAGRAITYNYFDQNRLFLGIVYPVSASLRVQAGYQNVFMQQPAGNVFQEKHVLRVFFYHTLDLRKQP